jgi:predicted transcriptional regulator
MLSVRLPEAIERDLTQFCASRNLSKSHVVQEALAEYMVAAKSDSCKLKQV